MSRILLGRGPHRSRPTASTNRPTDQSALDWEIGEIVSPELIELTPVGRAEEYRPPTPPVATPPAPNPATTVRGAMPNGRPTTSLIEAFRGPLAGSRLTTLVNALDDALDDWWSDNELPPTPILRDGLLALEAGHDLDEGHRTLLLRTALHRRKGIVTALRYQTDPERTAFVLKEALLEVLDPLPPNLLWWLKREDPASEEWSPILEHELRDELAAVQGIQHELAARGLSALTGKKPGAPPIPTGEDFHHPIELVLRQVAQRNGQKLSRYWSPGRALLVLLATITLLALFLRPGRMAPARMVNLPGGDYTLAVATMDPDEQIVTLASFAIDRSEITNANYRQCVAVGECLAPRSPASATKPDYFTNPAYDDYPVVNVSWTAAEQFCHWLGKRLPTAAEWEVAAGYSPILERSLRYPWGDLYQPQLANVRDGGLGEPRAVGSFQPNGNSPTGLFDMAGNVAEWTATAAEDGGDHKIVKGGSYQDGADEVRVRAEQHLSPADGLPWLGFRCAADLPESDWTS